MDACLNCGNPGHRATDCKHPADSARFKANLELFRKQKEAALKAECKAMMQVYQLHGSPAGDSSADHYLHDKETSETDLEETEDERSDSEDDQSDENEHPRGRTKGAHQ